VLVSVRVHPSSPEFKLLLKGDILYVWLTEPAEANKANQQLVKELSRIFGSCRLLRGASSRSKLIELPLSSIVELKQRLEAAYL
jgi:uncharacterized protein YggU (UPF0235/DUF167 family)